RTPRDRGGPTPRDADSERRQTSATDRHLRPTRPDGARRIDGGGGARPALSPGPLDHRLSRFAERGAHSPGAYYDPPTARRGRACGFRNGPAHAQLLDQPTRLA